MIGEQDLARARELLPWYVTGTLDVEQRAFVDQQLSRFEVLRTELAWLRKLQQDIRESAPAPSGDLGWSRLHDRIEAESRPDVIPIHRARRPKWYAPALALAATVLIAQTAVIGVLIHEEQNLRPLTGTTASSGAQLQVQFLPQASEEQIRKLLNEVHAQIVSGPGALGIYTVRVAEGDGEAALQRMRRETGVVESVSLLPK